MERTCCWQLLRDPKSGLVVALLMAGSMWFYVQHILIPYEKADAAARGVPRGILSDLYPRWVGARELLLHDRDPYSSEITREIQTGYYGRPLDTSRPNDPKDQQAFAYPVYVAILLAPTVFFPFPVVEAGFRCLLVALSAATVPLWLRVLGWRASATTTAVFLVLTLGSFPALQGFKLEQLSLIVCGLIAGSAALLTGGHLAWAGALLSLAMIKPQLALPFTGWLGLWAAARWKERGSFIWGFVGTMAALLGVAEFLLPGWIVRFGHAVGAYRQYAGGEGSLDVLITRTGGRMVVFLIVLMLIAACWRARREPAGSQLFVLISSLVLAGTVVIVPMVAPYNQLLLLPGIFLIVRYHEDLWAEGARSRLCVVVGALIVFWPWLASVSLLLASAVLPPAEVQRAWAAPLYTSLWIPFVVLALLALCIRRWKPGERRLTRANVESA